jgi:hypothetical protein
MKRKLFIGIPTTGQICIDTVISIIVSIREIIQSGGEFPRFYFRVGDADLCRARNAIIFHFLRSDCTDLVLVDSDISWPEGALTRLVSHDQDFVLGAYRGRTDEEAYFILWPEHREMDYPLLRVDGGSIGFCRLTRHCVEELVASLNGKHFTDPRVPDEVIPWLIDFETRDGVRLEEGYALCQRWRELGGSVWVDPMIKLGHTGPKIFQGDLLSYIRACV